MYARMLVRSSFLLFVNTLMLLSNIGAALASGPVIDTFSIPASSTSSTVSSIAFAVTDNESSCYFCSGSGSGSSCINFGLTYCLSESSSSSDCQWNSSIPTIYEFTGIPSGVPTSKTLYAFAKDCSGQISESKNDAVTITRSCSGISGKVTDVATGAGISDMSLTVKDMNMYYVKSTISGTDGNYCVEPPAGSYYLWVEAGQGYNGAWYHTSKCADPLTLNGTNPTKNINIPLAHNITGSISGKTKDAASGISLAGTNVSLSDSKTGMSYPGGISDANGNFLVTGLPSGAYNLTFSGQTGYYGILNQILVTGPGETTGVDAHLSKVPVISGKITNAKTNDPVASALRICKKVTVGDLATLVITTPTQQVITVSLHLMRVSTC